MKNQTVWASVVVVFMLVSSATTLVIMGKDVGIILTLSALVALPVLGAFGVAVYHKLDQVRELSNGGQTKLMDMQQRSQDQMNDNGQRIFDAILEMQKQTLDKLTAIALATTPPALPVAPVPSAIDAGGSEEGG